MISCSLDGSPPQDRVAFRLPPRKGTYKRWRGDDVLYHTTFSGIVSTVVAPWSSVQANSNVPGPGTRNWNEI